MRTLKFIVDGQIIKRDPKCDFENLSPGSEKYLKADFSFSSEWNKAKKVVAFYSPLGAEYTPQRIDYGTTCMIPAEACKKRSFSIKVLGITPDGSKIATDKIIVYQNGGAV